MANDVSELIGTQEINHILGLVAPHYKNSEALKVFLSANGLPPIGKLGAGTQIQYKWTRKSIELACGKLMTALQEEQQPVKREEVKKLASASSEELLVQMQRYFDTALTDVDDKIQKILNCVQAIVRMSGEEKQKLNDIHATLNNLMTTTNNTAKDLKKAIDASAERADKNCDIRLELILGDIKTINLGVNQILRDTRSKV